MTDRQRKLLDYLCSIYADPNLEVTFVGNDYGSAGFTNDKKAICKEQENKVKLFLSEPENDKDLSDWESEMLKADKLLLKAKQQESWEESNPNFYKAVIAKLKNLKKYKK